MDKQRPKSEAMQQVRSTSPASDTPLLASLVGPFSLKTLSGDDLTPHGKKTQALLALLATAPGLRRPRSWLQDKLWSDRGPDHGAASLRQTLFRLRQDLGVHADLLTIDRTWISLDPARIKIIMSGDKTSELLEGLDVSDPEFETWIRDQRLMYSDQNAARLNSIIANSPASRRVILINDVATNVNNSYADVISWYIINNVIKFVLEQQPDVYFVNTDPNNSALTSLFLKVGILNDTVILACRIIEIEGGRILWTHNGVFSIDDARDATQHLDNSVLDYAQLIGSELLRLT